MLVKLGWEAAVGLLTGFPLQATNVASQSHTSIPKQALHFLIRCEVDINSRLLEQPAALRNQGFSHLSVREAFSIIRDGSFYYLLCRHYLLSVIWRRRAA